nr:hypothetical protein CFP56_71617 [Quercus suber]
MVQVDEASTDSTIAPSAYSYLNDETTFLTQTNSLGVVTGMPSVITSQPSLPAGVSTQPEVATIPAGLAAGVNTLVVATANASANTFLVSVGASTTIVVGGAVDTDASVVAGPSAGMASASLVTAMTTDSAGSSITTPSKTDSGSAKLANFATPTSSPGAAANVQIASSALFGLGAIIAALL